MGSQVIQRCYLREEEPELDPHPFNCPHNHGTPYAPHVEILLPDHWTDCFYCVSGVSATEESNRTAALELRMFMRRGGEPIWGYYTSQSNEPPGQQTDADFRRLLRDLEVPTRTVVTLPLTQENRDTQPPELQETVNRLNQWNELLNLVNQSRRLNENERHSVQEFELVSPNSNRRRRGNTINVTTETSEAGQNRPQDEGNEEVEDGSRRQSM